MLLARRIALRPTRSQRRLLAQAAGCARFAYNWGLRRKKEAWATRKAALEAGTAPKDAPKVPTAVDLHRAAAGRLLNALKKKPQEEGGVPWMYESSKCAPQEALRDLDTAFQAFFRRVRAGEPPGFPRPKKKREGEGHFRLTGSIVVTAQRIKLPCIGGVRIQPGDRGYIPAGKYASASVVQVPKAGWHGEWFVSVRMEIAEGAPVPADAPRVGLDLGVRKLATLSDGTEIANPKALARAERRLKRAQRVLSRRVKGSNRRKNPVWIDARRRLARTHRRVYPDRVAHIRADALHKATTQIARSYPVVVIEDLRVKNMTRAVKGAGRAAQSRLNRAALDASIGAFRQMLAYKMQRQGGRLIVVNPAYTSQICSRCQVKTDCGSCETFTCAACGFTIDRDHNAARNILARSFEPSVAATPKGRRKPAARQRLDRRVGRRRKTRGEKRSVVRVVWLGRTPQ